MEMCFRWKKLLLVVPPNGGKPAKGAPWQEEEDQFQTISCVVFLVVTGFGGRVDNIPPSNSFLA